MGESFYLDLPFIFSKLLSMPVTPLSTITTNEVVLEPTNPSHAADLFRLVDQNRKHLGKWFPWVDAMQSVGDFEAYIDRCEQQHKAGTDYSYVIKNEGRVVGRIGIHYINQYNQFGAIGYWIGESFSGKGIVTKACQSLIRFCFEEAGLNRIEIKCATGNRRSAAVAERLGFRQEGIMREAEWVNGEFLDLNLYSLLKSEWLKPATDGIQ